MGQMLAVALAIIRNPKLVGRDAVAARKELINNVEEAASKALDRASRVGRRVRASRCLGRVLNPLRTSSRG